MTAGGETDALRDFGYAVLCCDQQMGGIFYFLPPDIGGKRTAGLFLEFPGEVVGSVAGQISQMLHRDVFGQMVMDIVFAEAHFPAAGMAVPAEAADAVAEILTDAAHQMLEADGGVV